MGLAALGIQAYMLASTTNKEVEKFVYKALDKGEGELKILYVTPEKISKNKGSCLSLRNATMQGVFLSLQ